MTARWTLVRHGSTALSSAGVYCGWTDVPLDAGGRAQLEALAPSVRATEWARVVVSPLLRCEQSAEILLAGSSFAGTIEKSPALRELHFGDWEGRSAREVQARFPAEWAQWTRPESARTFRIPGGESADDFARRVRAAGEAYARLPGESLIVTHAGCIRELLGWALGCDGWHFRVPLAGCVRLEWVEGYAVLMV